VKAIETSINGRRMESRRTTACACDTAICAYGAVVGAMTAVHIIDNKIRLNICCYYLLLTECYARKRLHGGRKLSAYASSAVGAVVVCR
jgi:hypothetical protein